MDKKAPAVNILLAFHTAFSKLPTNFRELVSDECNWSIPTFYRKMRGKDRIHSNDRSKLLPAISNAEKEAILRQAAIAFQEINDFMEKYRNFKR